MAKEDGGGAEDALPPPEPRTEERAVDVEGIADTGNKANNRLSNSSSVGGGSVGSGSVGFDAKAGDDSEARARVRSRFKKSVTVSSIAKAFKDRPRDAEIDRKVKEKLDRARKWQKLGYLGVLLTLVLILIIQIVQLVVRYYEGPTYVTTDVVPQSEAAFPAMTVCPEGGAYKKDVLEMFGFRSTSQYKEKHSLRTWTGNDTSVGEKELFLKATHCVQDLFERVYIRFFKANPETGEFNINYTNFTDETKSSSFMEQRLRPFGRCHTLYPEGWIRDLGIYYMRLKFARAVKIYFHRPGQFLDLSGRMGHKVYPGEVVQAQVSYEDIRMLSKEKDDGELTCTNSTYDDCMEKALEDRMLHENGCVVPWLNSDAPICTDFGKVNSTFFTHYNRVTNQQGDCPVPCESLLINVSGKNHKTKDTDKSELYVYFAPRVIVSKEHFLIDFLTLMSEVGGYVGLLLGFSFAHFLKWFNLAFEQTLRTYELNKAVREAEDAAKKAALEKDEKDAEEKASETV